MNARNLSAIARASVPFASRREAVRVEHPGRGGVVEQRTDRVVAAVGLEDPRAVARAVVRLSGRGVVGVGSQTADDVGRLHAVRDIERVVEVERRLERKRRDRRRAVARAADQGKGERDQERGRYEGPGAHPGDGLRGAAGRPVRRSGRTVTASVQVGTPASVEWWSEGHGVGEAGQARSDPGRPVHRIGCGRQPLRAIGRVGGGIRSAVPMAPSGPARSGRQPGAGQERTLRTSSTL